MNPLEHSLAAMSTHDHEGMSTDKHSWLLMNTKKQVTKGLWELMGTHGSITMSTHDTFNPLKALSTPPRPNQALQNIGPERVKIPTYVYS